MSRDNRPRQANREPFVCDSSPRVQENPSDEGERRESGRAEVRGRVALTQRSTLPVLHLYTKTSPASAVRAPGLRPRRERYSGKRWSRTARMRRRAS